MEASLSKAKLAGLRKLLQKKTREAEGKFLIEGWHLVEEALKAGLAIETLVYEGRAARTAADERVLETAKQAAIERFEGTESQLSQLSDTRASQGVVAVVGRLGMAWADFLERLPGSGPARIVLLDALGDPGNCGTIVRTADWFGFDGVVFGADCAELENGKTARATMGGLFRVPVAVKVDLAEAIGDLRKKGIQVFTTELDAASVSLERFSFPDRCGLVVGNEARGISPVVSEAADGRLFIPRLGGGESLNAGVAFAVCAGAWRLR